MRVQEHRRAARLRFAFVRTLRFHQAAGGPAAYRTVSCHRHRCRRAAQGAGGTAISQEDEGRFIWQLVGVLDTYEGYSATGASVMPVFSGLYGYLSLAFCHIVMNSGCCNW